MRVAYFDIETSDLTGGFGRIVCASVLIRQPAEPDEVVTFRNDRLVERGDASCMADDRAIAVALRDELEKHPITAGWYSKGFDIPFLNTRLVKHGERRLRTALHLDGIWYAKGWRGIKPTKSSLAKVAEFFDIDDERKVSMEDDEWVLARSGDPEMMDRAVERCESDVRLTCKVIEALANHNLVKNVQRYP